MGFLSNNFISDFFIKALEAIYGIIGSYGWSIVLLTIFFKLALLPLDIKQKKGMRKQKELQPKIDAINKKYANDREMQSKKTMEIYKKEGYSPFSGCLPMLIQMPVFFAFFGALRALAGDQVLELYNMAKAATTMEAAKQIPIESFLWVKNLWQPDTFLKSATIIPTFDQIKQYPALVELTDFNEVMKNLQSVYEGTTNGWFILPLAAGGMSFLQSHITMPQTQPTTGDNKNPMSGKMMKYFLPLFSVFICVTSSAAFALYWTVSNIISVASHVVIDKILTAKEAETNA